MANVRKSRDVLRKNDRKLTKKTTCGKRVLTAKQIKPMNEENRDPFVCLCLCLQTLQVNLLFPNIEMKMGNHRSPMERESLNVSYRETSIIIHLPFYIIPHNQSVGHNDL